MFTKRGNTIRCCEVTQKAGGEVGGILLGGGGGGSGEGGGGEGGGIG